MLLFKRTAKPHSRCEFRLEEFCGVGMIKQFFYKLLFSKAHVDLRSWKLAVGMGLFVGGWLGVQSYLWITHAHLSSITDPAPQTAEQVSSVERETELMSRFLEGLPDLERALDTWFFLYSQQTDGSVWFLSEESSGALNPSAPSLIGCEVADPSAEYPECRGNVYSFYELQCNDQSCSWTLCRHNEKPYSCTYSLHGVRDKWGRWENECNILLPQAREFCDYLQKEKGFIVNDLS